MNKVHRVKGVELGWSATFCGLRGGAEGADEYSTTQGDRFEAVSDDRKLRLVTCKRCKATITLA